MSKLFPRLYRALTAEGHSPAKAVEVLLAAHRRDEFALIWIRCVAQMRRNRRDRMRAAIRELNACEWVVR